MSQLKAFVAFALGGVVMDGLGGWGAWSWTRPFPFLEGFGASGCGELGCGEPFSYTPKVLVKLHRKFS